jgi:hypothetical protein
MLQSLQLLFLNSDTHRSPGLQPAVNHDHDQVADHDHDGGRAANWRVS